MRERTPRYRDHPPPPGIDVDTTLLWEHESANTDQQEVQRHSS